MKRLNWKWLVAALVFSLVVLAAPVFASNGEAGGSVTAEALALLIAGWVAPFLAQLFKSDRVEGRAAAWLAFGVAVLVALAAMLFTNSLGLTVVPEDPAQAVLWFSKIAGGVYALAVLVYKSLISTE